MPLLVPTGTSLALLWIEPGHRATSSKGHLWSQLPRLSLPERTRYYIVVVLVSLIPTSRFPRCAACAPAAGSKPLCTASSFLTLAESPWLLRGYEPRPQRRARTIVEMVRRTIVGTQLACAMLPGKAVEEGQTRKDKEKSESRGWIKAATVENAAIDFLRCVVVVFGIRLGLVSVRSSAFICIGRCVTDLAIGQLTFWGLFRFLVHPLLAGPAECTHVRPPPS
eukprot:2511863-Rhodomonas_salina.1